MTHLSSPGWCGKWGSGNELCSAHFHHQPSPEPEPEQLSHWRCLWHPLCPRQEKLIGNQALLRLVPVNVCLKNSLKFLISSIKFFRFLEKQKLQQIYGTFWNIFITISWSRNKGVREVTHWIASMLNRSSKNALFVMLANSRCIWLWDDNFFLTEFITWKHSSLLYNKTHLTI